nr:MAG TPA: hypothetical protein [Caudoviricetes sp.]
MALRLWAARFALCGSSSLAQKPLDDLDELLRGLHVLILIEVGHAVFANLNRGHNDVLEHSVQILGGVTAVVSGHTALVVHLKIPRRGNTLQGVLHALDGHFLLFCHKLSITSFRQRFRPLRPVIVPHSSLLVDGHARNIDVHGDAALSFLAGSVRHLHNAAIALAHNEAVAGVHIADGNIHSTAAGFQPAQIREAGRGRHEGDGHGTALVGVLRVGHVALCTNAGGNAVFVLGQGHNTVRSKAGDDAATHDDVDLFGVVGSNFNACSHLLTRSFLTHSEWPAGCPWSLRHGQRPPAGPPK